MRLGMVAIAASSVFALAACGGSDADGDTAPEPSSSSTTSSASTSATQSPSGEPTESATAAESSSAPDSGQVIEVVFKGTSVSPSGDRVEVKVGEPVELRITADEPGEIHVHSSPEQEIEYSSGRTTAVVTIERPGIVEVESHDLGLVIVQLEARP